MRISSRSHLALVLDLWSARALTWIGTLGGREALGSDAHLDLADRYHRLADYHRARGRVQRARRLLAKAERHWFEGGGDGPPYAAALAMPRPTSWTFTDAVARRRTADPDDVA